MSMQSYKVQFNEQIRRFSLPYDSTYTQLRKKLEELFVDVPRGFQMYYMDEENDKICINSQFEYDEAKRLNKMIIRLMIENREPKKNSSASPEKSSTIASTTQSSSNSPRTISSALADNTLVKTLLFIQPFITNPQLLKSLLPIFLTEINKNNIISKEDIAKICQHANQILDYPFVQEFLTNKLPKILHQIVGSQHIPTAIPTPTPAPVQVTEPPKNEKPPTEQIYDMFNNFLSFAQNVASNVSLPSIPTVPTPSSSTTPDEPLKRTPAPSPAPSGNNSDLNTSQYQPWLKINPTPAKEAQRQPSNINELCQPAEPIRTIYLSELAQLRELGFPESDVLISLLNNSYGDINSVIDQLTDFYPE